MDIKIYTKEKIYNFNSIFDKDYDYAIKHVHREDGPAIISYYENKNIYYEKYCLNGKEYSIIEFNREIFKRKLQLF